MLEGSSVLAHYAPDEMATAADRRHAPRQDRFPPRVEDAWEYSCYTPSGRTRGPAAGAALLLVGALLATLTYLNIAMPAGHRAHRLLIVPMALTPPPPPHQIQQRQEKPATTQPLIVAPPPIVATPAPAIVATGAAAPPPVVTPAPVTVAAPAPARPAAPPAVTMDGDLSSKMIVAKPPTYPLGSRRRHEEGTVVLNVLVSTEGSVAGLSVSQTSGSDALDAAALAAVRKWRWAPLLRNGEAVMVQGLVTIPFVLKH